MTESQIPGPENPLPPRDGLVLASASPRRRQILSELGLQFEIQAPEIDEKRLPHEEPEAMVVRLAEGKAKTVAQSLFSGPRRWVLGSDTVVVLDGEPIGKPEDEEHAVAILKRLCGRTHRVITGVAVTDTRNAHILSCAVESRVTLRPASEAEIRRYVSCGECLDKAGAYAIQGEGRRFVTELYGSESNVIGLPASETLELLESARKKASSEGGSELLGEDP
jgi:septum formation protein